MDFHNPPRSMSVTDIKVTMNDDVNRIQNIGRNYNGSGDCSWPVPICQEISCDEDRCLWHRCVLKLPQYVIWQAEVFKVTLEKKPEESFGFTQKAKEHAEDKDNFYFLVKSVDRRGMAASRGLKTGDLILSINQVAIQSKNKLSEINLRKMNTLHLQIQHPYSLSRAAEKYVAQLKQSMDLNAGYPHFRGIRPLRSPESPPTNELSVPLSPHPDNIPLSLIPKEVPRNGLKSLHKLPQARIFVVGHATCEFVQCFFGESIPVDSKPGFFHISMKCDANGAVNCGNVESFSYLMTDGREECINVELVCVQDESFFHHCCPWMFTPNSVFILTFEAKRLAQSPGVELSRLSSLAQTVRTGASWKNRNILLFGLSSGQDPIRWEEIQTLFYTLPDKYLPTPIIIPMVKELSKEVLGKNPSDLEVLSKNRLDLYQQLSQIIDKQNVILSTAWALDMLISHESFTITKRSLLKLLETRDKEMLNYQFQILEDLINTGNLIVTGGINSSCVSESTKEYLLPAVFFKSLSHLAKCMERYRTSMEDQNMNWKLCITGIATRSQLLDLAGHCSDGDEKFISYLEDLHLIIPVKKTKVSLVKDSGFDEDTSSMLFPFFLEDVLFVPPDGYERYFTLEASDDLSVPSFYALVTTLSQTEECQTFTMVSQSAAHFVISGLQLYLYFQKTSRQVHGYRPSSGQGCGKKLFLGLITEILKHQVPNVQFSVKPEEPAAAAAAAGVGNPCRDRSLQQAVDRAELPVDETEFVSLPSQFAMGAYNLVDTEEMAREEVLDMKVFDLKCILPDLHKIYQHLSIDNAWEHLAGALGLTIEQTLVYGSLPKQRLPAEIFITAYCHESGCTLREFLKALIEITPRYNQCQELAERLWNTALYHNSEFYKRRYPLPH